MVLRGIPKTVTNFVPVEFLFTLYINYSKYLGFLIGFIKREKLNMYVICFHMANALCIQFMKKIRLPFQSLFKKKFRFKQNRHVCLK